MATDVAGLAARRSNRIVTIAATVLGTIVVTLALMALSYGNGEMSDNSLSVPLIIHIVTVIPAIPLGAWVLFRRKGDALHRMLGKIWAMLMATTAISTLWFSLSWIHLFTLLVLVSLPLSIWAVRRGDIAGHRQAMEGMYIGLVVAGAFAFLPGRFLGGILFG